MGNSSLHDDNEIEIIYWGEEDDDVTVNAQRFQKRKKRGIMPDDIDLKKEWKNLLKLVVAAILIAVVLNKFIVINATVPTGSMEQTIHAKSRMLGSRLSYVFSEPERGDIIIFKYPDNLKEKYVKRVIGLPGEIVEIRQGVVYINGKELKEDYVYFDTGTPDLMGDYAPIEVPENSYFVLGDNRNWSRDSRYWESTPFVPDNLLLGKALFSYYPKIYWLK